MSALAEIQDSIQQAADRVGPAVVGLGRGWGVGSGVVVGPGRVLTNAHVLRDGEVTVTFADGRRAEGTIKGVDPDLDLASIDVDTGDAEPVAWNPQAEPPAIGAPVLALANPGGRGLRVTAGFVSSAPRSFRGPRGRRLGGAIEHTAPLPRGSSGGPLVDATGHLVGLNAIRSEGGLILAVPADARTARRADALGRGEGTGKPRLGVAIAPPRVARRMRRAVGLEERAGVLVRAVEEDTPASRAGIARGDLVVAAAGQPVERVDILYEALDGAEPDGELKLTVLRGSDERDVTVTFENPDPSA